MVGHGWQWLNMIGTCWTWLAMAGHGWTWLALVGKGLPEGDVEDEVVDQKLWEGAAAAGWMVREAYNNSRAVGTWQYVEPDGTRYRTKTEALAAAAPAPRPQARERPSPLVGALPTLGADVFVVQTLLAVRPRGRGREFLVRWKARRARLSKGAHAPRPRLGCTRPHAHAQAHCARGRAPTAQGWGPESDSWEPRGNLTADLRELAPRTRAKRQRAADAAPEGKRPTAPRQGWKRSRRVAGLEADGGSIV